MLQTGQRIGTKAHVQVKFCSDPVRSEDYFPEWKPALIRKISGNISASASFCTGHDYCINELFKTFDWFYMHLFSKSNKSILLFSFFRIGEYVFSASSFCYLLKKFIRSSTIGLRLYVLLLVFTLKLLQDYRLISISRLINFFFRFSSDFLLFQDFF